MARRLSLFCVVVVLGACLAGCVTSGQATLTPKVVLQDASIDDQDDMCIWIHPSDPAKSAIIASDKSANMLFVYDLEGKTIQVVPVPGKPGNIDIRYNFPLGGERVDIVAYNDRDNVKIVVFKVDPSTRQVERVDNDAINTGPNYGFTLYHSPKTGKYYGFTVADEEGEGPEQWELFDGGDGKVHGKKVRSWKLGNSEGCAADDETGQLYIGEEEVGIWKYGAEPEDPTTGKMIAEIGENDLVADVEGVTIYYMAGGKGYIIASSQGNNTFKVFRRRPPHQYITTFHVQGAEDTDGVDVTNVPLGSKFPKGLFALHNGAVEPCPVLVCSFADLGLDADTDYWDPREGN